MRHPVAAHVIGAAGVVLLAAACSSSKSTSPSAAPSQADAQVVAQGLQATIEASLSSFIGGVSPIVPVANRLGPSVVRLARIPQRMVAAPHAGNVRLGIERNNIPSCVVLSPAQPVDTDNDGIPDALTMTAGSNCTSAIDSVTTLTISGAISETDPTVSVPDADYAETVNNLKLAVASTSASASIGLNGTATVTQTPGTLTLDNLLTMAIVSVQNGQPLNATYAHNWTVAFKYPGAAPADSTGLTQGTLSITGSTTYKSGAKSFVLGVTTPTSLAYDPTCSTSSHITSGVLKGVFNGTNGSSFVTITWSSCQDPVVQFTGQ